MVKVKAEIKPVQQILQNHGLGEGGPVQKLVDSECMRYMGDYMPRRQVGELEHMMVLATTIGSGEIDSPGPFAHYLYEGILYVSPTTGSAWAKKNEIKVPTGKELTYNGAPMRGKKWFERMKADHKEDIIQSARKALGKGGSL